MSQPVIMVRPLEITDAMLTASNITENDYAEWAAGSYAAGQRVISSTEHKIYENLTGTNTDTPADDSEIQTAKKKRVRRVRDTGGNVVTYAELPDADTKNWLEVGPTNRWAMFDTSISTKSTRTATIEFTIEPGKVVNAVALLEAEGATVRVQMVDPVDGTVYDQTQTLQDPPPESTWFSYFFDEITSRSTAVFTDLPSYGSASITVTVDAGAGTAALGAFLCGRVFELGDDQTGGAQRGARIGITDYSKKEYDTFGNAILLKRNYRSRAAIDMLIPNTMLDSVKRALASVRATPTLFIASQQYDALVIYGLAEFDITIPYATHSQCALTLESLI